MGKLRSYAGVVVFALVLLMGHQVYGGGLTLNPGILFALIFHITLHHALKFFAPFLLVAGFYLDLLWGYPLGFFEGLFLLTYGAVLVLRGYLQNKPFWMIWATYGGLSFLLWVLGGLLLGKAGGVQSFTFPFFLSFLLSWVCYPLLSAFLMGLSRGRVRP